MNLSFTTKWSKTMPSHMANNPTLFVPKIILGLQQQKPQFEPVYQHCLRNYVFLQRKLKEDYKLCVDYPKLHTIRHDTKNRWKAGNRIHFYIYTRTKNQLRFAPIIKCTATQKIEIIWTDGDGFKMAQPTVWIDGSWILGDALNQLAINDGFNNVEDFFAYFNKDFTGKLIHWTNLKY